MPGRVSSNERTDGAGTVVCPLERAIGAIGGKWKMLVLRSLFVVGAQRYNSFLRTVPGISPKELTRNLRELEHSGLVEKTMSENGRSKVEVYALTELGSCLQSAFKALGAFGELLIQKRVRGSN